jgi:hypothetical protein
MTTELIVYGLAKAATERWQEDLLAVCKTAEQVERVKAAAARDGFHSFRVAEYHGEKPDFRKAVSV